MRRPERRSLNRKGSARTDSAATRSVSLADPTKGSSTMSDSSPIEPHGGSLIDLLAPGDAAANLAAEAANLPKLVINERELSDLEMLAVGALSPLTGFQGEDDYHEVLDSMHLKNGLAWAIPVVLGLADDDLHRVGNVDSVALLPAEGADPVAVLR